MIILGNKLGRRARYLLGGLLACTLIGLAEALQVYLGAAGMGRPIPFSRAASSTMPSWFVLAALVPGVLAIGSRFAIDGERWRRSLLVHIPAAALFALLNILIASWLSDYVFYREMPIPFWTNVSRLLGFYFILDVLIYAAILGLQRGFIARRELRAREREAAQLALRTSRLETSLTRAHLESLRMQLNPHFLFNTLNTVSVLAMKGERQRVVRMLTLLGDLLRLSLDRGEPAVSLQEEIEFLDRYLEIEQIRFGDRLQVRRDVDPAALDAEVPGLLLQPLVENSVRHGIARRTGAGSIDLMIRRVEDEVHITVRDTGPGFDDDALAGTREGVGLGNTRARLEQIYGERHTLELANAAEGGAIVRIRLPYLPSAEAIADYVEGMRSA